MLCSVLLVLLRHSLCWIIRAYRRAIRADLELNTFVIRAMTKNGLCRPAQQCCLKIPGSHAIKNMVLAVVDRYRLAKFFLYRWVVVSKVWQSIPSCSSVFRIQAQQITIQAPLTYFG